MKHKPVIIRVDQLIERIAADCDNFDLFDAIGINDPPRPSVDYDSDPAGWDRYHLAVRAYAVEHAADYVVAAWPDHVVNPRYNSDANYGQPQPLGFAKAENPSAHIYVA